MWKYFICYTCEKSYSYYCEDGVDVKEDREDSRVVEVAARGEGEGGGGGGSGS